MANVTREQAVEQATLARISRALAAFVDVLQAGMRPTLTSAVMTDSHWRDGEYDVVVEGGSWSGVLQEEIEQALVIAKRHGGTLFLNGQGGDGKLAILFEVPRAPGPDEPSPGEVATREARAGTRMRRKAAV